MRAPDPFGGRIAARSPEEEMVALDAGFGGFRPAAFRFLRDLGRNNDKAWFEANREVYEREVREPMRRLVETLDAKLRSIAPEIVGDPKRSMFRIHRDIRFSRDKSPYKTNSGAWLSIARWATSR
jgi:uncharacterized protein (TIGR02453 family)